MENKKGMELKRILLILGMLISTVTLTYSCGLDDNFDSNSVIIQIDFETSNLMNSYRFWGHGSVNCEKSGCQGTIPGGHRSSSGDVSGTVDWNVNVNYFNSNSDHKILLSGFDGRSVMITNSNCSATGFGTVDIVCSAYEQ